MKGGRERECGEISEVFKGYQFCEVIDDILLGRLWELVGDGVKA